MSIRMLYKVKMMIGAADAAAPDGESSDATTPASAAAASNTISFLIGFVDSFHSSFSLSLSLPSSSHPSLSHSVAVLFWCASS